MLAVEERVEDRADGDRRGDVGREEERLEEALQPLDGVEHQRDGQREDDRRWQRDEDQDARVFAGKPEGLVIQNILEGGEAEARALGDDVDVFLVERRAQHRQHRIEHEEHEHDQRREQVEPGLRAGDEQLPVLARDQAGLSLFLFSGSHLTRAPVSASKK